MDSTINAAARLLAVGDPLGALSGIALRNDPAALALRGTAMAQLGDLTTARDLLERARVAFGPAEPLSHARCVLALSEVALAQRDFDFDTDSLLGATRVFSKWEDTHNALLCQLLLARRHLLLGDVGAASDALDASPLHEALPPALLSLARLIRAQVAIRTTRAKRAKQLLHQAREDAHRSQITSLALEIDRALEVLHSPAGRVVESGASREVTLAEVEVLYQENCPLVDVCRRELRVEHVRVSFSKRPTLLSLLVSMAASEDLTATRRQLVLAAFGARVENESSRARLRVQIGRLRKSLGSFGSIHASEKGFRLEMNPNLAKIRVLLPPLGGSHPDVLALLSDGQAWTTSAIAVALGKSQRSAQRALVQLAEEDAVLSRGNGPQRRWVSASLAPITTALLLPLPAR